MRPIISATVTPTWPPRPLRDDPAEPLPPFWGRGGKALYPRRYQGLAGVWMFHGFTLWGRSWGLQLPRQEPEAPEFWTVV